MKVNPIGKLDLLKFRDLKKNRNIVIEQTKEDKVQAQYPIDQVVEQIHPKIQHALITKIIKETNDTKTFVLEPDYTQDTTCFAPFKAGEYVAVSKTIGSSFVTRPYAISSSPKDALEGIYKITVKRVLNGIMSTYLLDEAVVGDTLDLSAPSGHFTYSSIRDSIHVIGLTGGSGVTPFLSMASSILEGTDDFRLTLFYGAKTESDLIAKELLDDIACKTDKFKVIYVLSEEENPNYQRGFLTKEMIDPYITGDETFFISGSYDFYSYLQPILDSYSLEKKDVRYAEVFYPLEDVEHREYVLTVHQGSKISTMPCFSDKPLLNSLEEGGIKAPSKCHVGTCGFCRSRVIQGEVMMYGEVMRLGDKDSSYIHPCVSYPLSNITIEII